MARAAQRVGPPCGLVLRGGNGVRSRGRTPAGGRSGANSQWHSFSVGRGRITAFGGVKAGTAALAGEPGPSRGQGAEDLLLDPPCPRAAMPPAKGEQLMRKVPPFVLALTSTVCSSLPGISLAAGEQPKRSLVVGKNHRITCHPEDRAAVVHSGA